MVGQLQGWQHSFQLRPCVVNHSVMSDFETPWTIAHQAPLSMGFSRQEHCSDCHALLQGIFPTQGSNPGLLYYRQILYQLSHKGSLRIWEWISYPLSSGSSWTRNWTRVSFIGGRFFTSWASREVEPEELINGLVMIEKRWPKGFLLLNLHW